MALQLVDIPLNKLPNSAWPGKLQGFRELDILHTRFGVAIQYLRSRLPASTC
jgi:hypothetical protein